MQQAGIAQPDWPSAERIVTIESHWDSKAVEPRTGACGIVQELPCGKSGCEPSNDLCELRWANTYVALRYGGWSPALAFHLKYGWY